MNHSQRGLSTIVTAGILLSSVALMGTGLVTWSQSNLTERQANLSTSFSNNINKLKESLVLEYVWFDPDPDPTVHMTITNVGTNSINIVEIEFRDTNTLQTIQKYDISNGELNPSASYSFPADFNYVSYQSFTSVITTERGSIFSNQVTTP